MLTSYGLQDLRREQPAQLARASRGGTVEADAGRAALLQPDLHPVSPAGEQVRSELVQAGPVPDHGDRKSTRLNSSHANISYAVFCLKKKKKRHQAIPTKETKKKETKANEQ